MRIGQAINPLITATCNPSCACACTSLHTGKSLPTRKQVHTVKINSIHRFYDPNYAFTLSKMTRPTPIGRSFSFYYFRTMQTSALSAGCRELDESSSLRSV